MENKIVFEVTGRGEDELASHGALLFGDMKRAFLMVDGVSTFGEISKRAAPSLRAMLPDLMKELQDGGFIQDKANSDMAVRMVVPPRLVTPAQADMTLKNLDRNEKSELDFTSIMQAPSPEMMAEEGARLQAEKAKLDAQASALAAAAALQAQQEAAALRLRAEQDAHNARLKAQQASVAQPVVQTEIQSGQAAQPSADKFRNEDKVRMTPLRREADEREVLEAQTQQLAVAQARIWAAAEQRAAGEASAAQAVQVTAAAPAQPVDSVAQPVQTSTPPRAGRKLLPWAMLMAGFFVLALVALFVVPFVLPAQKYAEQLEQALSAKFLQPVHVGQLEGRLLPTPRLVLRDIYIGAAQQIRVQQAQVNFSGAGLLGPVKMIDSIELQSLQVSGAALQQIPVWLQRLAADEAFPVRRMTIHQGALLGDAWQLSGIEGDVNFDAQGAFTHAHLDADSGKYLIDLEPSSSHNLKIALAIRDHALPLLPDWRFAELGAKGELSKDDLAISEFDARIADGMLHGSVRLDWGTGWNAQGSFEAKAVSMQKISRLLEGNADGAAHFRMQAETPAELADSVILEGGFAAKKGTLSGMDIVGTASLHSKEHIPGGKTYFDELSGTFAFDDDSYHFRQMQITTEVLDATAALDVTAGQLSGKVNAKLKTHQSGLPVDLLIGGTTESPTLRAIR